eukprot:TRINITY_DN12376_c0_g1_i1.p2 TRINITY_DN12376_c0_g1~~TRINITY_DN12376_c0_g1_i1.p2  ORF type:complete len:204 (-),score=65.23 TRINITY_DN12376_c0_g1_i1:154-765(-)
MFKKTTTQAYAIDLVEVMRAVVRKASERLHRHMPLFGNIILRAMDIAKDTSGKELIESVTLLIKIMLIKYPFVVFYQASEFLAVGSTEGLIVIYALKQHQKLKVLEGHKGPINTLAFSKDGSRLASYCDKERALRVWTIKSGILSFTGVQNKSSVIEIDKCEKKSRLEPSGKKAEVYPKLEFGKAKNQIVLHLSHEEAYAFKF